MKQIPFKNLQKFLLKRFGIDSTYLKSMKCLLVKCDPLPTGLIVELSVRGFYVHRNIVNNYLIYRK